MMKLEAGLTLVTYKEENPRKRKMSKNQTMTKQQYNSPKERMANLELLRIVSMLLIVVLHFLGKGGWLTELTEPSLPRMGYVAWGMEALAIGSLNVYMLLSGYFLIESSFKVKRLLQLLLQVLFYSITIGVIAAAFGYLPEEGFSIYYLATLCLPISTSHYWFMTAYFLMYLFMPLLAQGVKKLTQKQFQTVLFLLIFVVCIIKSVVPIKLSTDMQGYDCIWYMCVFLVAAYIRLYSIPFFKSARRSFLVYLTSGLGIFTLAFVLRFLYLRTGKLSNMLTVSYNYNHILTLLASVALFYLFCHIKIKQGAFGRFACRIAPYALGVYLWHEHIAIRYEWQGWLYSVAGKPDNGVQLVLYTLLAVVLVFAIGILLDMLRSLLFRGLHLLLSHVGVYRRLNQWLDTLVIKAWE
ncbi:MAG: acyltransferase [Lachnospiraceae bacterium]|nr:acyltransferase [Lachnospiraceae bacterium]